MNNSPNFSDYHPSWEGQEFNHEEYKSLLEELSKKASNSSLMVQGHSLKVAGPIMQVWQKIKGWFGFENGIDPIKVDYELLKLLRYGKNHQFFNDAQIRTLLRNFEQTLVRDRQNERIAGIIATILSDSNVTNGQQVLNHEVTSFYEANSSHLHEAFWPQIFHRYITPLVHHNAALQFNFGRIRASEGNLKEAIHYMQEGIAGSSNSDWHLEYAKTGFAYIENLCSVGALNQAETLSRQIVEALKKIGKLKPEETALKDELMSAVAYQSAIYVKQGNVEGALKAIQNEGDKEIRFAALEALIAKSESMKASKANLGGFYLLAAEREGDLDKREAFLTRAISLLRMAPDVQSKSNLIKAYLLISDQLITNKQLIQARSFLKDAFLLLKESSDLKTEKIIERLSQLSEGLIPLLQNSAHWNEAIALTQELKSLHASFPETCARYSHQLAKLYFHLKRHSEALNAFEEAHRLHPLPNYLDDLKRQTEFLAHAALNDAHLKQAAVYFEKLHALFPKEPEPLLQLAKIHSTLLEWKTASDYCRRLLALRPENFEANLLASKIFANLGDQKSAIFYAEKAVKLDRDNPDALLQLFDLKGDVSAIDSCLKILDKRPNDWRIHAQLGRLYSAQKNYTMANASLQKAASLNKNQPEIFASLGQVAFEEKNYAKAIEHYTRASELSNTAKPFANELSSCHQILANQAMKANSPMEMLGHYKLALQEAPWQGAIIASELLACGDLLINKDLSTASSAYRLALPFITKNTVKAERLSEIHRHLASDDKKNRSYDNALKNLLSANELTPKHPSVLKELASCYAALGNFDEAHNVYGQLLKQSPLKTDIHALQGELFFRQGEYQKALNSYTLAASSQPNSSELYQPEITSCLIASAEKLSKHRHYVEALEQYTLALNGANEQQLSEIIRRLITLGSDLQDNSFKEQALKAYEIAIAYQEEVAIPPKQLAKAYRLMGEAARDSRHYPQAISFYQKALQIEPYAEDYANLGNLYSLNGHLEWAVEMYQNALNLNQQPAYLNKLLPLRLQLADDYYERGIHDPSLVRQEILRLVQGVLSSPYAGEIKRALSDSWSYLGMESSDNKEFAQLGRSANALEQIEKDGLRACELIQKAYDGNAHHMSPDKIPNQLSQQLHALLQHLTNMQLFYLRLQEETNSIVKIAQESNNGRDFANWKPADQIHDLSQAANVENRAKQAIKIVNQVIQRSPDSVPPILREKLAFLEQAISPKAWIYRAIDQYLKAYEMSPSSLRDHGNQLIDAFTQVGDYLNAAHWYGKLKNQFPAQADLLHIDPRVFAHLAQNSTATGLSSEQIYEGLIQSAREYEKIKNYQEALQCYIQALGVAKGQPQVRVISTKIIDTSHILYNQRTYDHAMRGYEEALARLDALNLSQVDLVRLYACLADSAKQNADFVKATSYYVKALNLQPFNATLHFQLSDVYYLQNDLGHAIISCQQAIAIDPGNPLYIQKLFAYEVERGDQYYTQGANEGVRESLRELIAYVVQAPYYSQIQTALGAWVGSLSPDNKELRSLGQESSSVTKIVQEGHRALELLKKAYDGGRNHKQPQDMSKDLRMKLAAFEDQLKYLEKGEFQKDSTDLGAVSSIEAYRNAIEHYMKALELSPTYGSHCNRLIDSYVRNGDFNKAIATFNRFESQFPGNALVIDPKAYIASIELLLQSGKTAEAMNFINQIIEKFPYEPAFKKTLSHVYRFIANKFHSQNNLSRAFEMYQKAISCGVDAEPECYIKLGDLYAEAFNNMKDIQTSAPFDLRSPQRKNYFDKATENYKKGIELDQQNAQASFKYGKFLYFNDDYPITDNPVTYLKQARRLDPTNVIYAYGLLFALRKIHENSDVPEVIEALNEFKALGGNIHRNYWEDNEVF